MKLLELIVLVNLFAHLPAQAQAHVSEGGFVLLLPTDVYITAGVAAVVLTVVAVAVLPMAKLHAISSMRPMRPWPLERLQTATSLMSLVALCFAVFIGLTGPRDPLSNIMPLGFWTVGWIGLISLAAVFGNLWRGLNPWTGLYRMLRIPPLERELPQGLGRWPATLMLLGFAAFLLADVAPDDPTRLAQFVAIYWAVTFCGMILFGPRWLEHFELGHAIFALYGGLAPLRTTAPAGIGWPGWRLGSLLGSGALGRGAGAFALMLLAVGSFDGINETYWWLGLIGVNPLEFPGRSAVIFETLSGLALATAVLFASFASTIWMGLRLARGAHPFIPAFNAFALCVMPIAAAYHVAHYLPGFLVSVQYTIAAINDPFAIGTDWLGIEPFRVTTGFFNSIDTVKLIWTTQAGLVVVGHVWSVLLSHKAAQRLFSSHRTAVFATLPLSLFMIAYTLLGLWLLAAPKGA